MTTCCFFYALLCNGNMDNMSSQALLRSAFQPDPEKCLIQTPGLSWDSSSLILSRAIMPKESVRPYQKYHCKKRITFCQNYRTNLICKVEVASRNIHHLFSLPALPFTSLSTLNVLWTCFSV